MEVVNALKQALVTARKNKEASKVTCLSTLTSEVVSIGKSAGNRETTDAEAVSLLKKLKISILENIEIYKARGDSDMIDKYSEELEIISKFIPEEISIELVSKSIEEIITSKVLDSSPKNIGVILKELTDKFGSALNKQTASSLVKEALSKV